MNIEVVALIVVLLLITAFAAVAAQKPASRNDHRFTKLLVPGNENEMMMIGSLLESEGIEYRIQNEHFGGLYPGPVNFALNERAIFVDACEYEAASALIREYKQE